MYLDVISKPIYRVLSDLTQESRVEVALPFAESIREVCDESV